jgi:hypothetical protein
MSKNAQISTFIKILLLVAQLFHADGRTGGHNEANSRFFRNFANDPENGYSQ